MKWPSGKKLRDRTVVRNMTERQANDWGERQYADLLATGEHKLAEVKAAKTSTAISVTDFYKAYSEAAEGADRRPQEPRQRADGDSGSS
ncbi:MAG: hypothetical protein KF795_10145 [Labilithrix sp.]|nr:hypothetical protein [Labilithrix sp.]